MIVAALGKRIALLAVLCAAFVQAACGDAGEELRIYASGPSVNTGEGEDVRAYQLALRDEGDEAGPFKLKLVALESAVAQTGAPTQASIERNARRAAADKRAIAYLGDSTSGPTTFSMPITNRAGLLHICASCSYVGLTRNEGALPGHPERLYPTGRRHFLHLSPNDHVQAAALVEYAQRENVDRVVILHDDQAYGKGLARLVAAAAPRAGISLTGPPHLPRGDIRGEARRAAAAGADALMAFGNADIGIVNLMRRAAKAAPGLLVFAGDSQANSGSASSLKDVGHRFRITGPPPPDPRNALAAKFADRYTETYGSTPFPNTFLAYEAMRRVIQATRAVGERADERAAIISAIFAAPEENTVAGRYRFNRNGDSTLTRFGGYRATGGKLVFDRLLGGAGRGAVVSDGTQ